MGITGLIPFLEKASNKINIKELRGCTVAVDTYCWLHRGAFACADKLSRGEDTDMYITFCLKYVNLLLSYDIKPILVFDGMHLPAKAPTEKKRREARENSKKKAAELLRLGKVDEARSHMRRCVDITHEMALKLIQECRRRNVDCIVAPYEADAQMAYLNKLNVAQYIITEDSDLVLFGCQKILFKLDLVGSCLLVEADKLHLAMGCSPEKFTFDKFRAMCILSGCDYLDSLPGIGLAKACKFILKTEETDIRRALLKIPAYLNMRNLEVSNKYITNFCIADATFKHMYVYDPFKRKMVRLYEISEMGTDPDLCSNAGALLDEDTAFQLALGNLNPFTLKRVDDWNPDKHTPSGGSTKSFKQQTIAKHKSIWQNNFERHSPTKKGTSLGCAFHFKKMNFSNAIITSEEAPRTSGETDILSLYAISPPRKRLCTGSSFQADQENSTCSSTPTKKTHNPFAKQSTESPPSVNLDQRTSLLKSISPGNKTDSQNNAKRDLEISKRKQKVKSRFFLSNVSLMKNSVMRNSNAILSSTKAIENDDSKQKSRTFDDVLMERDIFEEVDSNENDEGTASIPSQSTSSPEEISLDSGIGATAATSLLSLNQFDYGVSKQGNCLEVVNEENPVMVIDVSDDDTPTRKNKNNITTKSKRRRLGLSKVKVPSNQSRLSMFGFQKKPSLK